MKRKKIVIAASLSLSALLFAACGQTSTKNKTATSSSETKKEKKLT